MAKKRDRLEIIRDILNVIRDKSGRVKPTHILYKSNLSYGMMQDYLDELIEKKFIIEKSTEKSKTYEITEDGIRFLSKYNDVRNFMDSFGV